MKNGRSTADEAGASIEFIFEEAAASFELPALTVDEVPPAPIQAGAGTEFILKEVAASFQLQALTANELHQAPVLQM